MEGRRAPSLLGYRRGFLASIAGGISLKEVERRKATSQFADTVTIISAGSEDKHNLMTAAWVIPVSHDPPMIAVAISPKRFTHDFLESSDEFGISILSSDQVSLSQEAGTKSGRDGDKSESSVFDLENGKKISVPLVRDCAARLECKTRQSFVTGDHTLFVGEVLYAEADESKEPLVLHRRFYRQLGDIRGKYAY
jgi:flavin reductase (DIM6/NTAB) family NADH-FMN oxidoreductase RutF